MGDATQDPFEPDDALEQLLHRSSRSDVDSDRVDRLQKHWQGITLRRVRVQASLTMMVGVTVSIGAFLALRPDFVNPPIVMPNSQSEPVVVPKPAVAQSDDMNPSGVLAESVSSEAVFEQLVCVAVNRRIRQRKRVKQVVPQSREAMDDVVRMTVERIGQQQDIVDLVGRIQDEWSEQELLAWIEATEDEESVEASLALLSHIATSRSVPVLMRLRLGSSHHESSTRLIAQVGDPQLLARLASEETDPSLCQDLAAALLRRSHPEALFRFLDLVDDRRTSAAALAAVAAVEPLPIERLLKCLSSRSRKVRLTAAMVLGRSKDPQLSAHLVQLLRGSQTRRAAMVALVSSENDVARRFVDQASRDLYLAASVHAAQTVVNSFRLDS